jgi:hypothetical protein
MPIVSHHAMQMHTVLPLASNESLKRSPLLLLLLLLLAPRDSATTTFTM